MSDVIVTTVSPSSFYIKLVDSFRKNPFETSLIIAIVLIVIFAIVAIIRRIYKMTRRNKHHTLIPTSEIDVNRLQRFELEVYNANRNSIHTRQELDEKMNQIYRDQDQSPRGEQMQMVKYKSEENKMRPSSYAIPAPFVYRSEEGGDLNQLPPGEERVTILPIRNVYNKFDEIILPSSTTPYIGRDFVCFKEKYTDADYVSKRDGCMACSVDTADDWKTKNYKNTATNVMTTCLYSTGGSSDPSVWNKQQCVDECSKL
jgi:hypothetical protein